jgi:hypothetical protein
MRKAQATTPARRTRAKPLAVTKDAVKREPPPQDPESNGSLIGAVFDSQLAMARLMFQFSPLTMVTQQQALMIETYAGALNGALDVAGADGEAREPRTTPED